MATAYEDLLKQGGSVGTTSAGMSLAGNESPLIRTQSAGTAAGSWDSRSSVKAAAPTTVKQAASSAKKQTTSGAAKKSTATTPYSFSDFQKAANKAGVLNSFDANDLDFAQKYPEFGLSMISLYRDLGNAKTNEQKLLATEAMNQLRKNYGSYWTGESGNRSYATSYGSQIADAMDAVNNYGDYESAYEKQIQNALKKITGYGDFKYGNEKGYQNLLKQLTERKSFSYNPATDPLYASYKKMYNREGDRAAANALAQAAAATGGVPSSYAATAATQAGNYYAAQLADMIPELRNQALNEYNNEYALILQALGALDTDRSQKYQVYGDRYSQLLQSLNALQGQDQTEYGRYTDRYNRLQQALQNLQGQDESDYKRYLDMLNAEYQRDRDAVADAQQEFANAIQIYQLTGQATGPLADLLASAEAAAGGGGGGYGGGGYGGGSTKKTVNDLIGVNEKSAKSGKVTVPAYINGKQTTTLVDADKVKTATQAYLNTASRKGDITMQEYATLSAELANPGSTGPYAELAAIEGDLHRGAITSAQAQAKRQQVLTQYYQQQEAKKAEAAAQQQSTQQAGSGGGGTGGGDYSYYYQNAGNTSQKNTGGGSAAQNGSAGGGANRVNSLAANNAVGSRSFGTVKDSRYL